MGEREQILDLQAAMQSLPTYDPGGVNHCRITHHFAPGIYAREMFMPAGVLVMGKIHKTEHLNMLSQGHVAVSNKGETIEYRAPHTFVSPVGTKRALYAFEDSVWTTIHPTDLTDPDEIEKEIIADNYAELDSVLHERLE